MEGSAKKAAALIEICALTKIAKFKKPKIWNRENNNDADR